MAYGKSMKWALVPNMRAQRDAVAAAPAAQTQTATMAAAGSQSHNKEEE